MSKGIFAGCIAVSLLLSGASLEAQGIFEGMFDKAKRSAEQKSRNRLNQPSIKPSTRE
jgi:hypothetical protein